MPFHDTLLIDVVDRLRYLKTVEWMEHGHYNEILLLSGTSEERRQNDRLHSLAMRDLDNRLDRVFRYFDRHGLHELSV